MTATSPTTTTSTSTTQHQGAAAAVPPPVRWWTAEYAVYFLWLAWAFVVYLWELMNTIDNACHGECERRLHEGWLFGRRVDLTDIQWRDFRTNLPVLAAGAVIYLMLSHGVRRLGSLGGESAAGVRMLFYAATSLTFIGYLYGANALFVLTFAVSNYVLARTLGGSRVTPAVLWAFNVLVLLSTEWVPQYYKFAWLLGPSFAFLDEHGGIYRWYIGFNLVVLRMISFGMDYHWACTSKLQTNDSKVEKTPKHTADMEHLYNERAETPQPLEAYSLTMYLAYLFYIPLHIAGPTITFNAFASQVRQPVRMTSNREIAVYALKLAFALLIMEGFLHFEYCYAVTQSGVFRNFSPLMLGCLGYISLHLIWLKFYIIWRFFRLWAMFDNIETIENMNRCMSNNYNLQGFWRSWHRSFNRWLIRYIYVPLGGKKSKIVNTFVVFTFTALWHDLSLRLLVWGWLIALFVVPEEFLSWYFNRSSMTSFRSQWYYRHLCALGAAFNIFFMCVSNLIGFSVGVDGMASSLHTILQWDAIPFLLGTLFTFFAAAHIMFEWRAYEVRSNHVKDF